MCTFACDLPRLPPPVSHPAMLWVPVTAYVTCHSSNLLLLSCNLESQTYHACPCLKCHKHSENDRWIKTFSYYFIRKILLTAYSLSLGPNCLKSIIPLIIWRQIQGSSLMTHKNIKCSKKTKCEDLSIKRLLSFRIRKKIPWEDRDIAFTRISFR